MTRKHHQVCAGKGGQGRPGAGVCVKMASCRIFLCARGGRQWPRHRDFVVVAVFVSVSMYARVSDGVECVC